MEKFWACDRNKGNLQLKSRSFFTENDLENSKCLTLSCIMCDTNTCNGIQCIQYNNGITSIKENLDRPIEEANLRIISHIENSIQSKNTHIVLLSNDKDTLVLVLYFMQYFTSVGLKELWIQFGAGQNKRFIPVHKLSYKLDPHISSNLFKAHILTGSDITSKIVTKAAAIKCGQIDYLNNFGLEYSIKSQFENPEKYLLAALPKNSKSENLSNSGMSNTLLKASD